VFYKEFFAHFHKDLCVGLIGGFAQKRADNDRADRDSEKEQNLIFPFKDYMEKIPKRRLPEF
jgi:hypothetical protein